MHVTIYKAKKSSAPGETVFLVVPAEKDTDVVPMDTRTKLGELVEFKRIEIKPADKRIGADVDEILRQIDEKGYAIQRTKVEIEEYALGNA